MGHDICDAPPLFLFGSVLLVNGKVGRRNLKPLNCFFATP